MAYYGVDRSEEIIQSLERINGKQFSPEQLDILRYPKGMSLLACAGSGKALRNGTNVLTPKGWTPIEALKVGDTCYDENGKEQKVEGVFPQGKKHTYRINFSDAVAIDCCREHLWTYQSERTGEVRTETLGYILENEQLGNGEEGFNLSIPVPKPFKAEGDKQKADRMVIGRMVFAYDAGLCSGNMGHRAAKRGNGKGKSMNPTKKYLMECADSRADLLKGLCATGGMTNDGRYRAVFKTKKLARDVEFLAHSLGMLAQINEISNNMFEVIMTMTESSYNFGDTLPNCRDGQRMRVDKRYFKSIVDMEAEHEMTCIKVSSPNGLFITEDFIVTHNTTVLINLVAKRILNGEIAHPEKLLCCTYSNGGAAEIEDRLYKLMVSCGINYRVPVKTLHSTYAHILRTFGLKCDKDSIISDGERRRLIRDISKDVGLRLDEDSLEALDNMLAVQVNELLDDEGVMSSSKFTLENVSKEQYSEVRQRYAQAKGAMGKIDFDDMQLYVHNWICVNKIPQVLEYCWNTWEHFYIDEFQDTNKIQFEILQAMLKDKEKLVIIGDDDQSIYSWRGADPNIILDICGYYDIKKFILPTNYRCGYNIVDLAQCGVDKMSRREPKSMKAYNQGGSIDIIDISGADRESSYSNDLAYMSQIVANKILSTVKDPSNIVLPSDICVMSRNNANLCLLNNMLLREGIMCNMSENMKLSRNQVFKDLRSLVKLTDDYPSQIAVKDTVWKVVPYAGTKGANMVAEVMAESGGNLLAALKLIVNTDAGSYGSTQITFNDGIPNVTVSNRTEAKIGYTLRSMKMDTILGFKDLYLTLKGIREGDEKGYAYLMRMYQSGVEFMYKAPDQYRFMCGVVEYISKMYKELGKEKTEQMMRATEQYESGAFATPSNAVTLSTIHSAKGKEWKQVFILADDNMSFPSFYGINKMRDRNVKEHDMIEYIDSERRLHYVAQTRAKENLYLVCDTSMASVFLLEAYDVIQKGTSGKAMNNQLILELAKKHNYQVPEELVKDLVGKASIIQA